MSTTANPVQNATPPKKWYNVYSDQKELKFFRELARGNHEWRTTNGLVKKTKLTKTEVEHIVHKYLPTGIVQQHSKEPEKFRYHERAAKKKKKKGSIAEDNKKRRVKDASNPTSTP